MKVSLGKDQKGSPSFSQSNKKKTNVMMTTSSKDGKEAYPCVKVERPRSSGNPEKNSTEGSTSSDRVVYSAACCTQSKDVQTYIGVGKLNGLSMKVIQDTGCTGLIMNNLLVPNMTVIPGSSGLLQMVDHTLIDMPLAYAFLDAAFYKGHCKVMYGSFPVYPVIIGNVHEVCRMLQDPDWEAEDQP